MKQKRTLKVIQIPFVHNIPSLCLFYLFGFAIHPLLGANK